MLKIWFEDIDWESVNGDTYLMSSPNYFYYNSRLLHNYTPPTIIEDSWNGKTFPVQIDIWEGYQVQIAMKEISLQHLAKMQACKKLFIEDLETNEIIEVDTETNGGITVEPIGRLGTANQSFMLSFKSNRILSYPGLVRDNTHHLAITYDTSTYNFYTDYSVINFISDTEQSQYEAGTGIRYTAKSVNREGKKLLFFLMESDAIELKKYSELALPADVALDITTVPLEVLKCTLSEISEGLYKCEVEMITDSNVNYA